MLPLVFSASKASWQAHPNHGIAKENPILHAAVSKRYNNTCQYCGWVDLEFNEVSNIDENHLNNNEDNLILACPLCHQCLHLGQVAAAEGGRMIWAPELTQVEINHLARVYWLAEFDPEHKLIGSARALTNKIEHQSHVLEAHYVPGASDPGFWAEVLIKLTPEQYKDRDNLLKNIRLWPNLTRFKKMVPKWAKVISVNLPNSEWERLAKNKEVENESAVVNLDKDVFLENDEEIVGNAE